MKKKTSILLAVFAIALSVSACSKHEVKPNNANPETVVNNEKPPKELFCHPNCP